MAFLTPGSLLKLLQSMDSESKPVGGIRSPVFQVTGITPATSGDPLRPSSAFFIQLSDSLHSAYVSPSSSASDPPQLGQLVHIDRLCSGIPVPKAIGLRPLASACGFSIVGSPEPLVALPSPSSVTVSHRPVFFPKENLLLSSSSASKPKRRYCSPAAVSGRARSPAPSKCEVPSLLAAREDSRRPAREPAIVVPSRYRQPSPGSRRLSAGMMKLSPAATSKESSGKRRPRKSLDDGNSSSCSEQHPLQDQKIVTNCRVSHSSKLKCQNRDESTAEKNRTSSQFVTSAGGNQDQMPPTFVVYDRKWTDGSIPLDSLSQNLERLGKEALERKNVASVAAAEALEEALATESIIRSLSMFTELCSTSKTGNPLRTINTFLSIYNDVMKETSMMASLIASRRTNNNILNDAVSVNRTKAASLWVEVALTTNLEVLKLIKSTVETHSKLKGIEKIAIPCGDYPKSVSSAKLPLGTQAKASSSCFGETLKLAEALKKEMQDWFLKFVEGAISVGFFIFGDEASFNDNGRVAAVVFHLKRVNDWIDKVLSESKDEEILAERIGKVRQKICNFVMSNMGLVKPAPTGLEEEAINDDSAMAADMGSAFSSLLELGKS